MSGRKIKTSGHKSLSHPHKKGSPVTLVQPVIHPQYGTIIFPIVYHYQIHLEILEESFKEARKLQKKIFDLPVDKSNCRMLNDYQLITNFYFYVQTVVLSCHLVLEYFTLEVLSKISPKKDGNNWGDIKLKERLKKSMPAVFEAPPLPDDLLMAFADLDQRRHYLLHPQLERIVNNDKTKWDTVNLGWMIIERYTTSYKVTKKIIEHFRPYFDNKLKAMKKPGTIHVTRGLKFDQPVAFGTGYNA